MKAGAIRESHVMVQVRLLEYRRKGSIAAEPSGRSADSSAVMSEATNAIAVAVGASKSRPWSGTSKCSVPVEPVEAHMPGNDHRRAGL